nr:hypothetical protein [Treponemataceae bacterium]
SSYGMGIKIEPVLDIKEVKVDLSSIAEDGSLSYSGTFPEAGEDGSEAEPIDLSMIGSILGDNLQLTGAKVYAYINDNGLLGDNTITAKFDASYTTTDSEGVESTTTVALIDGADESTHVKTIDGFTAVPSVTQNSDGYVVATFDEDETSFVSSSFPTVLNAGPEDMMISYEVGLGEGDDEMWLDVSELINSDDDDSDEETEIAVEFGIFIALPVQLTVKQNSNGYAGLDIMGIINSFGSSEEEDSEEEEAETDLLGRTSADDGGLLNTVLDYIEKVALKVDYTNGSGMALSVNISDTNSSGATFSKVISIATGTGTQEISIDSTDAEYMMNTYPFYPDNFEIRIPGSTTQDMVYNIKREMDFEVSLTASVDANIDYTISLSGN